MEEDSVMGKQTSVVIMRTISSSKKNDGKDDQNEKNFMYFNKPYILGGRGVGTLNLIRDSV